LKVYRYIHYPLFSHLESRKELKETLNGLLLKPAEEPVAALTPEAVLKPVSPNTLKIGEPENYLNEVTTANITIPSLKKTKEETQEITDEELEIQLPKPRKYQRKEGRKEEEIGFIAEELPPILRRDGGYDLKALVAVLAYKVARLEAALRFSGSYQTVKRP